MSSHEAGQQFTTSAGVSQLPRVERIGLSIESKNAADALSKVKEAESAGVRQVWMTAGGSGADTLTFYAAAAAQTSRIRLGTSILPIYPRHPLVTAQQVLAISDLAPGRIRLGVGTSHRHNVEGIYGYSMSSPLEYLTEYVSVLRSALWNGAVDHHGKFFNVMFTTRKAQVPIITSALGEKAFNLAGQISDGAVSWCCPIPYLLNKAVPALKQGAKARNRPAPPVIAHVLTALGTDRDTVRKATLQKLERYLRSPFYNSMFAAAGLPVATDGSGSEALADELVVAGNETSVRQRLSQILSSGIDELLLALVPVADEEGERKRLLQLISSM